MSTTPHFEKETDSIIENYDLDSCKAILQELARTCPIKYREHFLNVIKLGKNIHKNDTDLVTHILYAFTRIRKGEFVLKVDFEDDIDSFLLDPEYIIEDEHHILEIIYETIFMIHACKDREDYANGYQLVNALSSLQISMQGSYVDHYQKDQVNLETLIELKALYLPDNFKSECMFIAYMSNSNRALACYEVFRTIPGSFTIKDLVQMGNQELPNFNSFIHEWIEFLGEQDGYSIYLLLKDALHYVEEKERINFVQQFVSSFPDLMVDLLKEGSGYEYFLVGNKALEEMPVENKIRSEIALLTIKFAETDDEKKHCLFEAFRSDTSLSNYLRLRLEATDYSQRKEDILNVIETVYRRKFNNKVHFSQKYIETSSYKLLKIFENDIQYLTDPSFNENDQIALILLNLSSDLDTKEMKSILDILAYGKDRYFVEHIKELILVWKKDTPLDYKYVDIVETKIRNLVDSILYITEEGRNDYVFCAELLLGFAQMKGSEDIIHEYMRKGPRHFRNYLMK